MLTELYIQDIVLIEKLTLDVTGGLTALTGETGAGKSILLDSLDLATGGRAEKSLVRQGAKQGIVSATFEPAQESDVWALLEENGLHAEELDGLVILRRVQSADGRARAFINDHPVSVTLLRRIGETLIEVHGQNQGQGFLDVAMHRALLDEFSGVEKKAAKVAAGWRELHLAKKALADHQDNRDQAIREADYLRHVVDELTQLAPQPSEETALAEQRTTLMAAEKVSADLTDALTILSEDSLETRLSSALGRIERAAGALSGEGAEALELLVAKIDATLTELQDTRQTILHTSEAFVFDEGELDQVEERLFALRAAARKHNTTPDGLGAFFIKCSEALSLMEEGEANLASLETAVKEARALYVMDAAKLSAIRVKAAKQLEKAVAGELAPLKLGSATFFAQIETSDEYSGVHGIDKVSFLVSTNPGTPKGPLKQIASGGELSRFVLALKAALVAKENKTVIIFDEVDAGVGGAVADAVGERLAKLAVNAQVLVVTHSPQVAARAERHWQVSKSGKTKVITRVERLSDEERVEEIARMLSGAEVTKEARAAAKKLLKAGATKPKLRKNVKASAA